MSMTSRERVLAAINHEEPDRVPFDLGATRVTGIDVRAYARLRDHLGIKGDPPKVLDVWQMLAWVEDPVIEALEVDVLGVPCLTQPFRTRVDNWRPWQLGELPIQMPGNFDPVIEEDGSQCLYQDGECVAKKTPSSPYYDRMIEFKVYDPLPPVETFNLPVLSDEDLEWLRHWAETMRAGTDKALVGEFPFILGRWGSYQEWMTTIGYDPDYVIAFYERKTENLLTNMELYAEAVGNNIDIVWTGEDFGTQKGVMLSPQMFKEIVAPYYKRLFDWVHENTSWKVFFHDCGGIYPIIDAHIEFGVDILNPVQTTAAGMEPARLKAEFGDRLAFWGGGIETQTTLPFGSIDEIREQVEERIQIFGPGGGFVFNPIHNVQEDVTPEKVIAMREAVREYGQYPL